MRLKNLFAVSLLGVFCVGCDPVSEMEANIANRSNTLLTIEFISADESLNKMLELAPDEMGLFQEGFDVGGTFLEPSLAEYDSVVIKNSAKDILRVYKANDAGRNIYNIDEYWSAREPSKRVYLYEYEIKSEEIE